VSSCAIRVSFRREQAVSENGAVACTHVYVERCPRIERVMYGQRDRGDAPIPPLTRAKARLARTATPTSSFSVPVPA
jgi:hypothetical protein